MIRKKVSWYRQCGHRPQGVKADVEETDWGGWESSTSIWYISLGKMGSVSALCSILH